MALNTFKCNYLVPLHFKGLLPVPVDSSVPFQCVVFVKQLMMRGHESRRLSSSADIRKPLSVQTDNTDSVDSASDADSEYMTCVPSPHTFSLSSLRRDNVSARGFAVLGGAAGGDARGCAKKVIFGRYNSATIYRNLCTVCKLFSWSICDFILGRVCLSQCFFPAYYKSRLSVGESTTISFMSELLKLSFVLFWHFSLGSVGHCNCYYTV